MVEARQVTYYPYQRFDRRPVVSLEREPSDARITKLVNAAISSGKRSPKTVALYAGISEGAALTALRERGLR